jgi:hypothetical protein
LAITARFSTMLSSVSSSTAAIDISNIYTIDVSFVGIYETVEIRRNTENVFSADNVVARVLRRTRIPPRTSCRTQHIISA